MSDGLVRCTTNLPEHYSVLLYVMRLFLGVEIPHEIKSYINEYLLPIHQSPKGWENPHDYHQTLLFIGDSSEDDLKTIGERMEYFEFRPFELTLDNFQFFNRRVMFLSFVSSVELLELKKRVEEVFPEWIRPGAKPFIPHVTVKRWQRYEYDHLAKGLATHPFVQKSFTVRALALFKSEKDNLNRKYHVIKTKPF